jgi:hypothetical protein
LPFAFLTAAPHTILGGDFNCVLNPADTNGALQPSRALSEIVRSLSLVDTWDQDPLRTTFTHHSPTGATRIDRIYVPSELVKRKSGVDIIPAAFTDSHALVLRLTMEDQVVRRRLRRWKMDPTLMHDDAIKRKIRDARIQWRSRKRHYPDVSMWWERCAKKELQRPMRSDDIERKRNFRHMENHLYECLYGIIRSAVPETDKFLELKRYKAKLVQLHAMRRENIMLDTSDYDKMDDEEPSLYHLLKTLRRRDTRAILQFQDSLGNIITCPQDISNIFLQHLRQKFRPIDINGTSFHRLQGLVQQQCPSAAECLEQPITLDEVTAAIRSGARQNTRVGWHLPRVLFCKLGDGTHGPPRAAQPNVSEE